MQSLDKEMDSVGALKRNFLELEFVLENWQPKENHFFGYDRDAHFCTETRPPCDYKTYTCHLIETKECERLADIGIKKCVAKGSEVAKKTTATSKGKRQRQDEEV